jgi:hypothetical protein
MREPVVTPLLGCAGFADFAEARSALRLPIFFDSAKQTFFRGTSLIGGYVEIRKAALNPGCAAHFGQKYKRVETRSETRKSYVRLPLPCE